MKSRLISLTGLMLVLSLTGCVVAGPGQGYPVYGGAPAGQPVPAPQPGAPAPQPGPQAVGVDPMAIVTPALILGGLWIAGHWLFDGGHRRWEPGHYGHRR